jgi:hypothetical protein
MFPRPLVPVAVVLVLAVAVVLAVVQTIRPQDQVGLSGHEPLEEQLGALLAENPNALNGVIAVNSDAPYANVNSFGY